MLYITLIILFPFSRIDVPNGVNASHHEKLVTSEPTVPLQTQAHRQVRRFPPSSSLARSVRQEALIVGRATSLHTSSALTSICCHPPPVRMAHFPGNMERMYMKVNCFRCASTLTTVALPAVLPSARLTTKLTTPKWTTSSITTAQTGKHKLKALYKYIYLLLHTLFMAYGVK